MVCGVCGRMSDFQLVEAGEKIDRLECVHCHAQRTEPSRPAKQPCDRG